MNRIRTRRTVYFASHDYVVVAYLPADDAEEYAMGFLRHWTCACPLEAITNDHVRAELVEIRIEGGKYRSL
jgi:hypothetical protein